MPATRARRALLLCAAAFLAVPAPALAQQPSAPPAAEGVTWSVVPSDTRGPDARRVVDLELAAGQRVTEHVAVTNHTARPVAFTLDANDGYLTERGVFDMRAAGTAPVDGGSWIEVPEGVTVAGGATEVVPVVVTAPGRATPGDHPAGVTASLDTLDGQVRVQNRVGVRFNIRVTGELSAALTLSDVQATYEPSWNPFSAGTVKLTYDVANEGNVRAAADTTVTHSTLLGDTDWTDPSPPRSREVLPGGVRGFETSVAGAWPLGGITTTVTVTPAAVGVAGTPVSVSVTTWAFPVPQTVLLVVVILVVLAVRAVVKSRKRRLTRMLDEAREEGRAEAARS